MYASPLHTALVYICVIFMFSHLIVLCPMLNVQKIQTTNWLLYKLCLLVTLLVLSLACHRKAISLDKTPEKETTAEAAIMEEMFLEADSIDASIIRPAYAQAFQATPTRKWDLLHTALDVSFDWKSQHVLGKAGLTLTPYAYPDSVLVLDAKNFDIHSIEAKNISKNLTYAISQEYDNQQLKIVFPTKIYKKDTLAISIHYTAKPAERASQQAGAITSDQGLFFINPDGAKLGKPQQIWTQGETAYNSCWFPTIDHPNERCTGEVKVTVENRFSTLSNGLLTRSTNLDGGKRQDHWVMDQPHAPYLFMLAIGEFSITRDTWRGKELGYWVEPKYASFARDIFNHTPEMLSFFSEKYGLEYPWKKYHQVVVRDYVSGAMENTTAVIFGDFVQKTRRQLMMENNDKIVAHEMAHHWFGNYVTCESWSNLTMNEGFANYAEYLWLEHKYGRSEADAHREEELNAYLESTAEGDTRHLIRFEYDQDEEMFDAHSYNKGGLVLHMLRHLLGDEVFFEGIRRFLQKHAFEAVEAHQLRLAMEDVSGRDLYVFFDQWFYDKGHPELEVNYFYNPSRKEVMVFIEQVQSPEFHRPLFTLHTELAVIKKDGSVQRIPVEIKDQVTEVTIAMSEVPGGIVLDPDYTQLAKINQIAWKEDSPALFSDLNANLPVADFYRIECARQINFEDETPSLISKMLSDQFWQIRALATEYATPDLHEDLLWSLAENDPNPQVRGKALTTLLDMEFYSPQQQEVARRIFLKGDKEVGEIVALAMFIVSRFDAPTVSQFILDNFDKEEDSDMVMGMLALSQEENVGLSNEQIVKKTPLFQGYDIFSFLSYFYSLIAEMDVAGQDVFLGEMASFMAHGDSRPIQRYAFMTLLSNLRADREKKLKEGDLSEFTTNQENLERLIRWFEEIRNQETNAQIKAAYEYMR
jgi:aminopeptidase N